MTYWCHRINYIACPFITYWLPVDGLLMDYWYDDIAYYVILVIYLARLVVIHQFEEQREVALLNSQGTHKLGSNQWTINRQCCDIKKPYTICINILMGGPTLLPGPTGPNLILGPKLILGLNLNSLGCHVILGPSLILGPDLMLKIIESI